MMKCNGEIINLPEQELKVGIDTGKSESVQVEEIIENKKPKFKVGDRVKLIKLGSCTHGFNINDVCVIRAIDDDDYSDTYPITIEKCDHTVGYVNEDDLEKIESEEN